MTKSSQARKARKAQDKPNGILELKMSPELKYKLWTTYERTEKLVAKRQTLEAQIETINAQIANSNMQQAAITAEICDAHEGRLKGEYVMEKANFAEGKAIFARKA